MALSLGIALAVDTHLKFRQERYIIRVMNGQREKKTDVRVDIDNSSMQKHTRLQIKKETQPRFKTEERACDTIDSIK